jgi:uncharacterized protein YecT (DUF1311 family)
MDPIRLRDRLQAAWIELRDAEVAVHEMARAINEGSAKGWTKDQRAAAYQMIVQEMNRLPRLARCQQARDALDEARGRLMAFAEVPF